MKKYVKEKFKSYQEKSKRVRNSFRGRKRLIRRILIRSIFGYVGGVILTYIWFFFLATQMNMTLTKSTKITCIVAIIFTLGLSYNKNIRVIIILILPSFFSSKGRSALVAYIFVLAALGPTKNILENFEVLSKSISCGQEQLKEALKGMLAMMKRPLETIKEVVSTILKVIRKTMIKVEKVLKRMMNLITSLLKGIRDAFDWLANIVNMCNKKIGTPFQRCMKIAENAMEDCRLKLGMVSYLCEVGSLMKTICYSVKFIDYVCVMVDFVSDEIVGTVTKKLEEFTEEIRKMFYVEVKFNHKFKFKTTSSKSLQKVGEDIIADLRQRTKKIFLIFGWTEILGSLMFFRVILKAYSYKMKYLNSNRFDNYYVTKEVEFVDEMRKKLGKEPILPLTRKEKRKYIQLTSLSLTKSETLRMARSIMFLMITTFQLFCLCFADYSLFWILWIIRENGLKEAGLDVPTFINVNVTGQSFLTEIYTGIVESFQPITHVFNIDPIVCLPNPKQPVFSKYYEIGFLLILCWIMTIFEPYGLRLRQVTMRIMYPERAKERAIWLASQILMRRTSFIKFARRKARQKFTKNNTKDAFSCIDWIRARTERWWIFRKILGKRGINYCMLCSSPFASEEDKISCPRPGCNGKYCKQCFEELDKKCFLCRDPMEYGDFSDISEEKGSSDLEDVVVRKYCQD